MSSRNKLKVFQQRTVSFVLEKLKDRSTYAIADEVGLGKTWTVAEIGLQLALKNSKQQTQTIFYIAPSFELIDQNLKTIEAHFKKECQRLKKDLVIQSFTSRLSRISHDIAVRTTPGKRHIFIVGLSPETSFRIRGKGSLVEREVLAALMSTGKNAKFCADVENYFWNLDTPIRDGYRGRIHALRNPEILGEVESYQNCDVLKAELADILAMPDPRYSEESRKSVRTKLGGFRKAVVNRWMKRKHVCTLLILDEWHKYKATCFKDDGLLNQFIAKIRDHKSAKLLLVSATPFAVHFEDTEQGDRKRHQDDFKSLFELYYGKDLAIAAYDRFRVIQDKFLTSIETYVRSSANVESPVAREAATAAKEAYETSLLEICVRTERPATIEVAKTLALGGSPVWADADDSLRQFLKRFASINTNSPVSQMWLDGHTFLEHKEYRIAEAKLGNLEGDHWKLERLKKHIQVEYKGDRLHSLSCPPLWRHESSKTEKHLVFTEYGFLPHEITAGLQYGEIKDTATYKGSVLGYFPLRLKSSKRRSEEEKMIQKNIYWIYFYPWLALETGETVTLPADDLDAILETSEDLVDAVIKIDKYLCSDDENKLTRLAERLRLMSNEPSPELRVGAKKFLREIFVGKRSKSQIPGAILARCAAQIGLEVASEGPLLEVANALLKLFASPEAQLLKKKKYGTGKRDKRENMFLKFAVWYCEQYDLEGTLSQYFYLLQGNSTRAKDVLSEVASAIGLKRSTNMSRCARPFNDKKEVDNAEPDVERLSPKSLRAGFNSPFPPYVLISTSIGQEGLDFHRYCDRVIHWSPPSSPSVLQQREGRVDRFQSLQNRKVTSDKKNKYVEDEMELSPDFVVLDPDSKRLNKTQRFVMYLPYSQQEARWKKCVQRMYYNNLLIGVPDPLGVEKRFEALLGGTEEDRRKRLEQFNSYCVSLKPRE